MLGQVRGQSVITVLSGDHGDVYTVEDYEGRILAKAIGKEELVRRFPAAASDVASFWSMYIPFIKKPIYRTWIRNGEKLSRCRMYNYGGEDYPHEVWFESRHELGKRPVRIRVKLDSLSVKDIAFLREHYPRGFPKDYRQRGNGQ